jgi:hypothetical protein
MEIGEYKLRTIDNETEYDSYRDEDTYSNKLVFSTTGCKYSFYMQRTKFGTYIFHRFMELVSALQSMWKNKEHGNISLIFSNGQFPMSNTSLL